MKVYKPISDREVARRLGVRSIHTAYYYLQTIQEIYDAGLIICERLSTNEPQGKWINGHHINGVCYKRCDQCFAEIEETFFGESSFDVNFCPNCGADMRDKNDE